ncbi:MOSC domain-containing protein [Rummeliibacillus pycnus]|uniref:MOSC domain-containing protein n=1 Tax=Rummeliibacillus pycnus TaxID=101070 RepID=UPI000C9C7397|nr:MOSC domain-containing protein [Rummeliibacillus pycnus]
MEVHNIAKIVNFSIGLPKEMRYGKDQVMDTGICKQAIHEAYLTKDGFRGDGVADLKHHGGLDRAVCIYPFEHYAKWEKEFGKPLDAAAFGENLTVTNMLEENVCIGDIFQVGDAIIQITQGRIPCNTISRRVGHPLILKRLVETGFVGYLCRVLKEGTVSSDSKISLVKRHPEEVSVLFCMDTYFHRTNDVEAMKKILNVSELADKWREKLEERVDKYAK